MPAFCAAAQTTVPGGTATGMSSIVRCISSSFFSSAICLPVRYRLSGTRHGRVFRPAACGGAGKRKLGDTPKPPPGAAAPGPRFHLLPTMQRPSRIGGYPPNPRQGQLPLDPAFICSLPCNVLRGLGIPPNPRQGRLLLDPAFICSLPCNVLRGLGDTPKPPPGAAAPGLPFIQSPPYSILRGCGTHIPCETV